MMLRDFHLQPQDGVILVHLIAMDKQSLVGMGALGQEQWQKKHILGCQYITD